MINSQTKGTGSKPSPIEMDIVPTVHGTGISQQTISSPSDDVFVNLPPAFIDKEANSKRTGDWYLKFRNGEYIFKIIGAALIVYRNQPTNAYIVSNKSLTGVGLLLGNVGNVLQATQGCQDLKICHDFPAQTKNSDIKAFSYVAILRGSLNLCCDISASVHLFTEDIYSATVSGATGMSTDVLGFIKNIRDVGRTSGWKRFAYILCAASRIPLILGSLFLTLAKWKVLDETKWFSPSLIVSIVGMTLFTSGGIIRNVLYQKSTKPLIFSNSNQHHEEIDQDGVELDAVSDYDASHIGDAFDKDFVALSKLKKIKK